MTVTLTMVIPLQLCVSYIYFFLIHGYKSNFGSSDYSLKTLQNTKKL